MMHKLNVALLQILPGQTLDENLQLGLTACQKQKPMAQISHSFQKCGVTATPFQRTASF